MEHAENQIRVDTAKGRVDIRAFCTETTVRNLSFNGGFGDYANYRSIYTRKETLEKFAGKESANVVLAISQDGKIIGFGVLDLPAENERWRQVGEQAMLEIKALEISREWRSLGLAPILLERLLSIDDLEARIIFLVGYSWTWDLEGTGKTVLQYRKKLIDLYTGSGFKEYQTNDFNICLKPENFFMARVGKQVTEETHTKFRWTCFGIA